MHPEVQAFFDKPTNTVSYVVKDPQSNICAIIDPVLEYAPGIWTHFDGFRASD